MGNNKKKKKGKISLILLWIFIIIFLISTAFVVNELIIKPKKNSDTMLEAQEMKDENLDYLSLLKTINPDIISWINIPNTVINYPVVHPTKEEGDDFYLKHNFKKEYSAYGSIFVDLACGEGDDCLNSKNIILHGHHMRNGSMFAQILNYEDLDFYKSSPIITFNSEKWEVFAIIKVNTLTSQGEPFNYLQYSFANNNSFLDFIYNVRERSLINTPVTINENDQIMTMSTCSYEYKDFRTAVYARKVRPGESTDINTNLASVNANALWPDCYYKDHNAIKPNLSDFNTALRSGKINWYTK